MGTGNISAPAYARLLRAAAEGIRAGDPDALVVGFAGTPLTTSDPLTEASIPSVLALDTVDSFDVLSEHAYSQLELPETHYPIQLDGVKAALHAAGAANKPIWHSEQGLIGNDNGYNIASESEADVAQLYIRNVITAASQGSKRFFWFSADVPPTYDFSVFYTNCEYIFHTEM